MIKSLSLSLALVLASPLAFGANLKVQDTSGKYREYTITGASISKNKLSIQGDAHERKKADERETEYFNSTISSLRAQGIDAVGLINLIASSGSNTYIFCHMKGFEPGADKEFICDSLTVGAIITNR